MIKSRTYHRNSAIDSLLTYKQYKTFQTIYSLYEYGNYSSFLKQFSESYISHIVNMYPQFDTSFEQVIEWLPLEYMNSNDYHTINHLVTIPESVLERNDIRILGHLAKDTAKNLYKQYMYYTMKLIIGCPYDVSEFDINTMRLYKGTVDERLLYQNENDIEIELSIDNLYNAIQTVELNTLWYDRLFSKKYIIIPASYEKICSEIQQKWIYKTPIEFIYVTLDFLGYTQDYMYIVDDPSVSQSIVIYYNNLDYIIQNTPETLSDPIQYELEGKIRGVLYNHTGLMRCKICV